MSWRQRAGRQPDADLERADFLHLGMHEGPGQYAIRPMILLARLCGAGDDELVR